MTYKFIVASQKSRLQDTILYKSMCTRCIDFSEVIFFGDNKRSLNTCDNEGIATCLKNDIDIAVFVHDDVIFNCSDLGHRIQKYANMFDVTGLAGNTTLNIKEPVLWHLMSSRENLRGCVAHGNDQKYMYTSYGPIPERVLMIDGVFMIVNLKKLPLNVRFDEDNPSRFHFYDLIFSMDCSLNKVKIGVGDVPIIHASPGLRDMHEEWKQGQAYFLNKYQKYSGKTLTV